MSFKYLHIYTPTGKSHLHQSVQNGTFKRHQASGFGSFRDNRDEKGRGLQFSSSAAPVTMFTAYNGDIFSSGSLPHTVQQILKNISSEASQGGGFLMNFWSFGPDPGKSSVSEYFFDRLP